MEWMPLDRSTEFTKASIGGIIPEHGFEFLMHPLTNVASGYGAVWNTQDEFLPPTSKGRGTLGKDGS